MSETPSPTVGIVIPVYNGERFLQEAIDSALAQESAADEVVVWVHDSADKSLEIAEAYGDKVRALYEDGYPTIGDAWNRAFELSNCNYFVFLHGDDLLHPQCIRVYREALAKLPPEVGILSGAVRHFNSRKMPHYERDREVVVQKSLAHDEILEDYFENRGFVGTQAACFATGPVRKMKVFNDIPNELDTEWIFRLMMVTKAAGVPRIVGYYRSWEGSVRERVKKRQIDDCERWWMHFKEGRIPVPEEYRRRYEEALFGVIAGKASFSCMVTPKGFRQFWRPMLRKHKEDVRRLLPSFARRNKARARLLKLAVFQPAPMLPLIALYSKSLYLLQYRKQILGRVKQRLR